MSKEKLTPAQRRAILRAKRALKPLTPEQRAAMGAMAGLPGPIVKPPPSHLARMGEILIDSAVGVGMAEELRQLWRSMKVGEPVNHVFWFRLGEAVLYCRRNPMAGSAALAYVLGSEFREQAFEVSV